MPNRPVHWYDGMFVGPHHFQYAERQSRLAQKESEDWFHPFDWGILSLEVDEKALARYEVVVTECQARFRDGTRLSIPGDCEVDTSGLAEDLAAAFQRERKVLVNLAIPTLHHKEPNVEPDRMEGGVRTAGTTRYFKEDLEVEDESDPNNPLRLVILRPRCRLLVAGPKVPGYLTLPLLRLSRAKDGGPQLDARYVPPLLAIDGWKPLWRRIQSLHSGIGGMIDELAPQVADRALLFGGQNPGDAERVLLLSVLNGGYSAFQSFVRVPGLTPLDVYRELCRLFGQLALFGPERRPDELPAYDHDNLGYCFDEVIRRIEALLKPVGPRAFEKQYFERSVSPPPPKQGAAAGPGRTAGGPTSRTAQPLAEPSPEYLHARLKDEWVKTVNGKSLYLGVESRLGNEECYRQVRSLEMKLGSATWARESFRQGLPDLELVPVHTFLPQLPSRGVCYFRVRRKGPAWAEVKGSCTMGLQFNWEHARIGPDNRTVSVGRDASSIDDADRSSESGADVDGGRVDLKFALYVTEEAES